jgi:trans-2,3-dihydro-3-hydroxyanthranilate isomerase
VEDLLGGKYAPLAVSCGVPFLFVPLANLDALGRARLAREAWERSLANYWAQDIYLFTLDPEQPAAGLRARMFAPRMGIVEDPATGAAATALAGYLSTRQEQTAGQLRWVVEQGVEMGRPSRIEVEADLADGQVTAIRVGGRSVLVSQGSLTIPAA